MANVINNQIDILAMPSAAKMIKEKNINISEIKGTGKDNRVTKGDVLLYLNLTNQNNSPNINKSNIDKNSLKKGDAIMDVLVPILGESVVEATVSKWIKKQGDFVEIDEPIVELETDKVTLEVPAAISGIIDHLAVSEGDTVEVGALLAMIVAGKKPLTNTKPIIDKIESVKTEEKLEKEQPKKQEIAVNPAISPNRDSGNLEERVPMSRLRQAIARRLKEAQNTAAMLTTYNEVDMTALMEMRSSYQDSFEKKNGVRLGYMSFFVKAAIDALRDFLQLMQK